MRGAWLAALVTLAAFSLSACGEERVECPALRAVVDEAASKATMGPRDANTSRADEAKTARAAAEAADHAAEAVGKIVVKTPGLATQTSDYTSAAKDYARALRAFADALEKVDALDKRVAKLAPDVDEAARAVKDATSKLEKECRPPKSTPKVLPLPAADCAALAKKLEGMPAGGEKLPAALDTFADGLEKLPLRDPAVKAHASAIGSAVKSRAKVYRQVEDTAAELDSAGTNLRSASLKDGDGAEKKFLAAQSGLAATCYPP